MQADELAIYLAPWQKRMVKDFMPASYFERKPLKEISKVIIGKGPLKCPQSYKIPVQGIRRGDWVLYLTDEQMLMVKEHFGIRTQITSVNVDPASLESGAIKFM